MYGIIFLENVLNVVIFGFRFDVFIGDLIIVIGGYDNLVFNCDLSQSLFGGVVVRDFVGYGFFLYVMIGLIEWLIWQGRFGVNNLYIYDFGGGGIFFYNSDFFVMIFDNNFVINNIIYDFL